jgi:hypothetical protein
MTALVFRAVRQVSDAFLLQMAEVSAGLIGLFLVGVFFYVETGFRRAQQAREVVDPYFRASARIVLVLFAIPIGLSVTLVALEPAWPRVLFLPLSALLVATNVATASRVRPVVAVTGSGVLTATEVIGSAAVAAIVTVPWILGGLHPTREDLTWAILLSFATGFLSIGAIVTSAFDVARLDPPPDDDEGR